MGATFGRIKTWIAEVLDYPALNAEFDNILNNLTPIGTDDYSTNVTQMRITTDRGEVGTESLATSLAGELERLRFAIKEIKGNVPQWYSSSTTSLSDLLNAVGGALVDNRVSSGASSTQSSALRALIPGVSSNLLTLDGTPTPFTYLINGSTYTISTDLSLTGLGLAPSTQNTALVNDATMTAQEASKWQGEDGRSLIIDTVGTAITALVGQVAAFKITHAGNTEYFTAYVKSGTELTNCRRGYFFGTSGTTAVPRIAIADNDTITLMRLTWVYVNTAGALTVAYNNPSYSFTQPSAASTGDYWYDLTAQKWKIFDSVNWNTANVLLIGLSIQDTANVLAARAFDMYSASDSYNDLATEYIGATQIQNMRLGGKIAVGNFLVDFKTTKPTWDITANLESGYAEAASTTYFAYVGESGRLTLSPEKPYYDAGNSKGWYHPYEVWRYVGQIANDGSSNFDASSLLNGVPYEPSPDANLLENVGFTATVAANALTIKLTTKDGHVPTALNPVLCAFRDNTATTGQYRLRRVTDTLSITVPNGASIGHVGGQPQYVWIYLIDDAGVIDIGVSGVDVFFDVGTVMSATAVSGASTSGRTLYAVGAHTNKSVRLAGRIKIQEATAGTWATAPTEVTAKPIPRYNRTEPVTYTPGTLTSFGTVSANNFQSWRDGVELVVTARFTKGTQTAVGPTFSVGFNGTDANVTMLFALTNTSACGTWVGDGAGSGGPILWTNNATVLSFGNPYGGGISPNSPAGSAAVTGASNGDILIYNVRVPIKGWSAYGP